MTHRRALAVLGVVGVALWSSSFARSAEVCLPSQDAPALVLRATDLVEGPDAEPVTAVTGGAARALACAPGRAVVGFAAGDSGRISWIERTGGSWRLAGESRVRGIPLLLHLAGARLIAVLEGRRETMLAVIDGPEQKPVTRELAGEPTCLTEIESLGLVALGIGNRVHTFRGESAGTWIAWTFDAPVTGCDASPDTGLLLVATGSGLVLVHPGDRAVRGRLPARASRELDGQVTEVRWTRGGQVAAVRLEEPSRLAFVSGRDLAILESAPIPEDASRLASVADGWVVWAGSDGALAERRIGENALAAERSKPLPVPPMNPPIEAVEVVEAAPRQPETKSVEVPAEPEPEAVPEMNAPAPRAAEKTRAEPPTVVDVERAPRPEPSPGRSELPAPARDATPEQPARVEPAEPMPEPAAIPAPEIPPARPDRVELTEPSTEPSTAPALEAAPPPRIENSPPRPVPAGPVAGQDSRAASGERLLESALRGELTGEASLVFELVVLGPDNILKEHARVAPNRRGGRTIFALDDLPPGSYRVIPMGRGGITLLSRPAFQTITIGSGEPARANFEIVRALPR